MTFLTMSQKELDHYNIICRLIQKEINGTEAADLLNISVRHIRRLKSKVKELGAKGLIHGNRGRKSNHSVPQKEKERIIKLLHCHYYDFKPAFAAEKLAEDHNIARDSKTVRQIMIDEKLWRPRKKKKGAQYRKWRKRKDNYGEMIQFDGSYERWFEKRASKCCLLAAIDDATGRIVNAKFAPHEGVFPVFSFWRKYVEKHSKPRIIYTDRFSTYKMGQKVSLENHDTQTQFQRAMEELHIEPIFANSPQAKGRVERLFNTLQDRLIKELRLANISTIKEANIFLEKAYIPKFNKKFSVKARGQANLHTPLTLQERKVLDSVFSKQTERTVQNDFTISFRKQWYQLTKEQQATICKKDRVIMEEHLDNSVHIRLRSKYLNYEILPKRLKTLRGQKQPWVLAATARKTYIPPQNHPWRRQPIYSKEFA